VRKREELKSALSKKRPRDKGMFCGSCGAGEKRNGIRRRGWGRVQYEPQRPKKKIRTRKWWRSRCIATKLKSQGVLTPGKGWPREHLPKRKRKSSQLSSGLNRENGKGREITHSQQYSSLDRRREVRLEVTTYDSKDREEGKGLAKTTLLVDPDRRKNLSAQAMLKNGNGPLESQ